MRRNLIWMIIFLVACTREEVKPKLLLADDWEVIDVSYDGVEQLEWKGLEMIFTQTSDSAGLYQLPETPYDTVWSASGTWRLGNQANSLLFDENIEAAYAISADDLEILAYLPRTKQSYCYEDICLPIVSGDWVFNLKRKK